MRGIARAFVADIRHKGNVQGASTIEQQFIKNALQAQSHRTIFEKLREAALAYQLSHKWSKDKIITAYLNTIYFGNGAYGIEAAAQTYFGHDVNHLGCGTPGKKLCVEELQPWEAALLAGIIQLADRIRPRRRTRWRPRQRRERRARADARAGLPDAVALRRKRQRRRSPRPRRSRPRTSRRSKASTRATSPAGCSSRSSNATARRARSTAACGSRRRSTSTCSAPPNRRSTTTSPTPKARPRRWSRSKTPPARCARWWAGATTTKAPSTSPPRASASPARRSRRSTSPRRSRTASRRARCGPPSRRCSSCPAPTARKSSSCTTTRDAYAGSNTLTGATAFSDNSIYAEVGLKVGTRRIALLAHRMGITTPLSTNPAMTIGGLTVGVTPIDMAHAYETIAHGGQRVSGSMASDDGPVGIQEVDGRARAAAGRRAARHQPRDHQARAARGHRTHGDLDARNGRAVRHRARRCDRPVRGGQDRHHLQLRRRVVRGLELQVHRRRVGRLPEQADPDDHRRSTANPCSAGRSPR